MKSNIVYWSPWELDKTESIAANILFGEPVPVLKDLGIKYEGAGFLECPAYINYCKNMFVIKAEMDITFTFDMEKNWMSCTLNSQAFYDRFAVFEKTGTSPTDGKSRRVTIPSSYLFYSEDEMMVESISPFLQGHSVPINFNIVPGTYDISKWIRPIECSGQMLSLDEPLKVKRGDALMYLKFIPKDNGKVTLQRETISDELLRVTLSCTSVKYVVPRISLESLYKLAEPLITLFKKNKRSKCPFRRFWK